MNKISREERMDQCWKAGLDYDGNGGFTKKTSDYAIWIDRTDIICWDDHEFTVKLQKIISLMQKYMYIVYRENTAELCLYPFKSIENAESRFNEMLREWMDWTGKTKEDAEKFCFSVTCGEGTRHYRHFLVSEDNNIQRDEVLDNIRFGIYPLIEGMKLEF